MINTVEEEMEVQRKNMEAYVILSIVHYIVLTMYTKGLIFINKQAECIETTSTMDRA